MTSQIRSFERHRPLFSVVVPCRGREALLDRALRSVFAQTEGDWEVIVVDDASPSPLASIVSAFGDPRLRCLRLNANVGPGAAREVGLERAEGRFAAFLDSDDVWLPDLLERHRRRLEDRGPVVSVVAATLDRAGRTQVRPSRASRPGEHIASFLFLENQYAQISGVAARTDLARRSGFGALRQYEDWFFLIRAETFGARIEVDDAPGVIRPVGAEPDSQGSEDDADRAEAFIADSAMMLRPAERDGFALRCLGPALARRSASSAAGLALAVGLRRPRLLGAALKLLFRCLIGARSYARLRDVPNAFRLAAATRPRDAPTR